MPNYVHVLYETEVQIWYTINEKTEQTTSWTEKTTAASAADTEKTTAASAAGTEKTEQATSWTEKTMDTEW